MEDLHIKVYTCFEFCYPLLHEESINSSCFVVMRLQSLELREAVAKPIFLILESAQEIHQRRWIW